MTEPLKISAEWKFIRFVRDQGWEYVERINSTGVVVIVAMNKKNEVILTEQYRAPMKKNVIEFPAGLAGDLPEDQDEDFSLAAKRELLEETGYEAGSMKFLTKGPPSPGLTTETIDFYRAKKLKKVSDGGGVDGEDITVHEIPFKKVERWLKKREKEGVLVDPKVYAGLYFLLKEQVS